MFQDLCFDTFVHTCAVYHLNIFDNLDTFQYTFSDQHFARMMYVKLSGCLEGQQGGIPPPPPKKNDDDYFPSVYPRMFDMKKKGKIVFKVINTFENLQLFWEKSLFPFP